MFFCNRVVVQAPGKVNLCLDITGINGDGYHLMDMVMQTVDLCDLLLIGRREGDGVRITCSRPTAPEDETNIAYKTAMAFFAAVGLPVQGLSIHIDKRIPVEAGLAGGSADAAAVLVGLDRLFETGLGTGQLQEIGLKAGADVPFCLQGGCALARGTGEILTPQPPLPDCRIVLAKPAQGMSTRYAFKLYDTYAGSVSRPDTASMLRAVSEGDLDGIGRNMFNVFSQITGLGEVEALCGRMLCDGALGAVMSGSGTAVAGLFRGEREAKACLRNLRGQAAESFLTKPTRTGAEVIHAD